MKTSLLLSIFLLAAAAAVPAETTSPLAGNWKLHNSIQGHESDLDCTFTQTNDQVQGNCTGERGSLAVTGKVSDTQVTLQYKTEYQGDELTIVYTGKLESAAKIAGTVSVQPLGVDGEFTAVQVKK